MADQIAPSANPEPAVLETEVPLSQSLIWRLQRDFYAQRGIKAWTEDMVPSYITNNPFIAEIYAQIVAGFVTDCMQQAQRDSLSAGKSVAHSGTWRRDRKILLSLFAQADGASANQKNCAAACALLHGRLL